MRKTFYIFSLLFVMTNCKQTNESIKPSSEEKLFLMAFVSQNLKANQKLGWKIIKDDDIIEEAKKKYNLLILDTSEYKVPKKKCALEISKTIQKNSGNTFFVIANQEQCWFSTWKLSDSKESIMEKLSVGNGP